MACKETGRDIEYIRFPIEHFDIYLHNPKLWRYIKPINIIKILVLKICALWDRKIAKRYGITRNFGGFIGLMFTTQMHIRYVLPILSYLKKQKDYDKGRDLEILFHPGGVKPGECYIDPYDKSLTAFYSSKNRWVEADTLKQLKKYGY